MRSRRRLVVVSSDGSGGAVHATSQRLGHARVDHQPGFRLARRDRTLLGFGQGGRLGLPSAERRLDPGFHGVDVEVAHRHEHRPLGPVPAVIIVGDQAGGRGPQNLHLADRQAGGQALALQKEVEAFDHNPIAGRVAGALLRQHDASLAVHRGRVDREVESGLAQQLDRGVDRLGVGSRHIQLVDGLREAGRGVGVGAERQAQTLQDLHHLAFLDLLRPVEGHVLEEVGQPGLLVRLHHRPGREPQAEGRLAGGNGLPADRVPHAVGQGAEADRRVRLQVRDRLRPLTGSQLRGGLYRRGRRSLGRDGLSEGEGERGGKCGACARKTDHQDGLEGSTEGRAQSPSRMAPARRESDALALRAETPYIR